MKRIGALFFPPNCTLPNPVTITEISRKITDETLRAACELKNLEASGLKLPNKLKKDTLRMRHLLRIKLENLLLKPFNEFTILINGFSSQLLSFLLSTAQKASERVPQARQRLLHIIGRMLASGELPDGRLLDALNTLKLEWHTLSPCQQAETFIAIYTSVSNVTFPTHRAFQLLSNFVDDTSLGWAHEDMRRGCSHLLTTQIASLENKQTSLSVKKLLEVMKVLHEIAKPMSQYRPIFEVHCRTIATVLDCSIESFMTGIGEGYQCDILVAKLDYLQQHLSKMSREEQVSALWNICTSVTAIKNLRHPAWPKLEAFVDDTNLGWAHEELQKGCSYVVQTQKATLEGNHTPAATARMNSIILILSSIHDTLQYTRLRPVLETHYNDILNSLAYKTENEAEAMAIKLYEKLFQALFKHETKNWNSMNAQQQATVIKGYLDPGNFSVTKRVLETFTLDINFQSQNADMRTAFCDWIEAEITLRRHEIAVSNPQIDPIMALYHTHAIDHTRRYQRAIAARFDIFAVPPSDVECDTLLKRIAGLSLAKKPRKVQCQIM